ncbi:AAA family ATPase [Sulfuricurvum sp.]|uniref:AAA family ATPase n=1 Tax=Sulfuricurvum sp. TaxID=2025608 RepID=UPI0019B5AA88|nr:AAA family ATPase [Sulfuricurvum sp.]MBD3798618.1 AAA family ATPase [Campylobacterota bacterium]MBD3805713.1 AAA family ATPase [Sulfuricurvum sp.]
MIERFYVKELLTFKEAELEFHPGLVVFTGPSGSGKSILMRSILASVGLESVEAQICESSVAWEIDEENYGIQNESPNIFRHVKKEKTRYFINSQSTSKSSMEMISRAYLRHLSLKDYSDFEPSALLEMLDRRIMAIDPAYVIVLEEHQSRFLEFKSLSEQLKAIEDREKNMADLKEFAQFEIQKIDTISPRIGEDEELNAIKKQLSKKEKIEKAIAQAKSIFAHESAVSSALGLLEADSSFFDDAMNELHHLFESAQERLEELEEVSVESILNRIEQIAELKRRYGGVEEALAYRDQKRLELESYEAIEESKSDLIRQIAMLKKMLDESAIFLSSKRRSILSDTLEKLNGYLGMLYLREATLEIEDAPLGEKGCDRVVLGLEGTKLDRLSSGEFNRLRLALLALGVETLKNSGGVLMLDEIDANLSGEESMSVAKVLRHLSSRYQIFVISHQPQLTSMGEQHFLIYKDDESHVRELSDTERIEEIARIISGDAISDEARRFAKDLFERSQGKQ